MDQKKNPLTEAFKSLPTEGAKKGLWAILASLFWLLWVVVIKPIATPLAHGLPPEALENGVFSSEKFTMWALLEVAATFKASLQYVTNHPTESSIYALGFAIAFAGLVFTLKLSRHAVGFFTEGAQRKGLLSRVGLYGFRESTTIEDAKADVGHFIANINRPDNRILNILGATGWETFGAKNSPLHEAVKNFSGTIRIILIDPTSRFLCDRAGSVGMKEDSYRKQVEKSIKWLTALKAQGKHVELALYDSIPNWKMIFTARAVWLQHYKANIHVAETPVYLFYSTDDQKGLYHAFYADFERIWDRAPHHQLNGKQPIQVRQV
ncbi:MAG: hypothetical protein ACK4GK_17450 [Ferrovibrio sp.]